MQAAAQKLLQHRPLLLQSKLYVLAMGRWRVAQFDVPGVMRGSTSHVQQAVLRTLVRGVLVSFCAVLYAVVITSEISSLRSVFEN